MLPLSRCASIITLHFHYHGALPLLHPVILLLLPSHRLVAAIKSLVLLLPFLHRTSIIASYFRRSAAAVSSSAVWSSFCGSIWTKKSKIVRFCQMNTHDMNRSQTCRCKCLPPMLLIHSATSDWKRMAKVKCECKQQLSNMVQPPATTTTNNNIIIIVKIATNIM